MYQRMRRHPYDIHIVFSATRWCYCAPSSRPSFSSHTNFAITHTSPTSARWSVLLRCEQKKNLTVPLYLSVPSGFRLIPIPFSARYIHTHEVQHEERPRLRRMISSPVPSRQELCISLSLGIRPRASTLRDSLHPSGGSPLHPRTPLRAGGKRGGGGEGGYLPARFVRTRQTRYLATAPLRPPM